MVWKPGVTVMAVMLVLVLRHFAHAFDEITGLNDYVNEPKVQSVVDIASPVGKKGEFKLAGMQFWHHLLGCEQIEHDVVAGELIGEGAVKKVYLAKWRNYNVALSVLQIEDHKADFIHGLEMLKSLGPHERLVQLVGFCTQPLALVTEFHSLGNAANAISMFNSLQARFQLCVDYVAILSYLHESPLGTRVMCDTNNIDKTLQQYLVTDNFRLVVNDLDALPQVTETKVKCGHRRLTGDFVAPEQLWPYEDKTFSDDQMPGYDEKTDIWKIPQVCEHFLRGAYSSDVLMFHLFMIHSRCKSIDPKNRPTAKEVLKYYLETGQEFFNDKKVEL